MTNAVTNSTRAARKEIELLVERLLDALKRHDAAMCAALFTDDGVVISPWAPPARGPDAIRATHQAWFDQGETNKRLTVLEANACGDLAYCLLAWSGDYPQSDGSVATYSGTSVNVLQRHANGDWKIEVQSLNPDAESRHPACRRIPQNRGGRNRRKESTASIDACAGPLKR